MYGKPEKYVCEGESDRNIGLHFVDKYCLPVYVFIFKPGFKLDGSDRADFGAPTSPTSNRRFDILLFDLKYLFQLHR